MPVLPAGADRTGKKRLFGQVVRDLTIVNAGCDDLEPNYLVQIETEKRSSGVGIGRCVHFHLALSHGQGHGLLIEGVFLALLGLALAMDDPRQVFNTAANRGAVVGTG